jgi:hypothetical protein
MAADQVPKTEGEELTEKQQRKYKNLPLEPKQQGKTQQAPRPKTQRKQSQKGG